MFGLKCVTGTIKVTDGCMFTSLTISDEMEVFLNFLMYFLCL